jgi:hypothetical protein
MNRFLALIGALLLAFISVSSACTAAEPGQWVHFTLEAGHTNPAAIHASFQKEARPEENNWSTDFRASDLVGLDLAGFRAGGTRPLRFSVIREAGRLDCTGHGGDSYGAGNCTFSPDPSFADALASRGIGRPSREQQFALMAVSARRELIDELAQARYPMPSIDNFIALSALGVDRSYIAEMARAGYRPASIDGLIQFKALNITPEWISQFARIGYANLPTDELVQLKALDITPEYIASFDRVGYHHLPVDQLVQLKAMNITPDYVRRIAAVDAGLPPVEKLVELKAFDRRR